MAQTGTERRGARNPLRWIARELMSIRLTVWLLIVMWFLMVIGSIFPQGYGAETYIGSWGEEKYQLFNRFGLLDLFHSPLFQVLGGILLLNLVFCSVLRWAGRRGGALARPPAGAREVALTGGTESARKVLASRGYKVLSESGETLTARKGPWPEGVSLLYHLGMGVAIVGFFLSAVFAFEGDITLYPDEPVRVPTVSADTWLHRHTHAEGDTLIPEDRYVELTLKEFITHWELYRNDDNPDGKYYPRDWMSDLTVVDDDGNSFEKMVEVNRPLRVSGLTFYQMAYEQEFDVVVSLEGEEVERVRANAYVPFALESVGGMFFPGTLRVGTLYEKYRETVPVVPHVTISWQPPEEPVEEDTLAVAEADSAAATEHGGGHGSGAERVDLGVLSAEEPLEHEGYVLTLENPYEGSVLSYRHDPGVTPLYIAITAFILGLVIRTYWPSYRVQVWAQESGRGRLTFRATGMLGEPEAIEDELVRELEGGTN